MIKLLTVRDLGIFLTYFQEKALHKKRCFPLKISSVNMTKSAGNCGFGQIYLRNA